MMHFNNLSIIVASLIDIDPCLEYILPLSKYSQLSQNFIFVFFEMSTIKTKSFLGRRDVF